MKRLPIHYWLIGVVIAAIAVAVSFHFDDTVRDFMFEHQTRGMRNFMRYVSLLGDWPTHAAAGLVLLWLAWRRGSQEWTRIFIAMLLALMVTGVVGTVIKRAVPRARPSVHAETRWGGPHFSTKYHSFPSGHVGASSAFFAVLILARRRVGLWCLLIPILIGISRMYLGAHHLSDVVCAAVLGTLCALVVAYFLLLRMRNRQSKIES